MIIEIQDIVGKEEGLVHIATPPGITLGDIIGRHDTLKRFSGEVVQAQLNGQTVIDSL